METFRCDSCGREFPRRRMKEIFYEEGYERVRKQLCPECLDEAMNASREVRGVAGQDKRAGVHLDPGADGGTDGGRRKSLGTRRGTRPQE